jgi:NADH dehydrogenase
MQFNIPETGNPRIVILGGGFAGLTLARKLAGTDFQVVLIDRLNYHQFQPLFYQVAMAGLEPSSIVFPFRKLFQRNQNVVVRMAEVERVDPAEQLIHTNIGPLHYDYLVIAVGATTNYYGNENIRRHAIPMKSVSEALYLRNQIFEDYESAVTADQESERLGLLEIAVVGGGPTGVEIAGSLAEMKKQIIPKDYSDQLAADIKIHLIDGTSRLLGTMSPQASAKAESFLQSMGVTIWFNKIVADYDGKTLTMQDGSTIQTQKVIWAAGITGNRLEGLPDSLYTRGNRIKVNAYNQVEGFQNILAVGDIAFQTETAYPNGHPQVAQVAIQQARLLAHNLKIWQKEGGPIPKPFQYKDLGSMATIGRNKAVADLPFIKFQGILAWFAWLFVHLMAILGAKNKLFIFLNWMWSYLTYDQSLRLIIKPFHRDDEKDRRLPL